MTPEYIRHPRCVPAHDTARSASYDMIDRQATEILELKARIEAAARREVALQSDLHDANNRLTKSEGALQMLAPLVGLGDDATPRQVLEAAMERLK